MDYFQGPQAFQLARKGLPALREVKTGFKKMAIAESVLASALQFMKFFPGNIDLSKDASKEPPSDILSLVHWKYGAAAVVVLPHSMAAALSRQKKARLQ